ncbi:unnamed protein product [Cyprideis torosa]|uniref:Uncharacterized protein n=1 Tax=Cyprideis torosa TaxID=163714 RepID=A0A7R8ZL63_9CRUS|nr:unnamed protein product [Cyprideis torosa]CAG0892719.1 unnamed protein product [Cyprideis torosa]
MTRGKLGRKILGYAAEVRYQRRDGRCSGTCADITNYCPSNYIRGILNIPSGPVSLSAGDRQSKKENAGILSSFGAHYAGPNLPFPALLNSTDKREVVGEEGGGREDCVFIFLPRPLLSSVLC